MTRTGDSAPADREGGFTLIELMVVGVVLSLISLFVATAVIGGVRTASRAEKRTDDVGGSQRALLQMSADLRAAVRVEDGTGPSKVVVLTRAGLPASATPADAPHRVTYELRTTGPEAGDVLVTREPGEYDSADMSTWRVAPGPAVTRTLLRRALVPSGTSRPLFTYLSVADSRRQCTTAPSTTTLGATGAALTGAEREQVFAVDIWLSVNSGRAARPLTLSAGVTLTSKGVLELDAATAAGGRAGIGQGCAA